MSIIKTHLKSLFLFYLKKLILYLILFSSAAFAQLKSNDSLLRTTTRNTIYIELAGQGGFYSVGYDRLTEVKPTIKRSFSVGASVLPIKYNNFNATVYSLPISFNTITRRFLELGIGLTPLIVAEQKNYSYLGSVNNSTYTEINTLFFLTPKIGFRYQEKEGGLFFRASFIPMINLTRAQDPSYVRFINPWGGLSIGHTF